MRCQLRILKAIGIRILCALKRELAESLCGNNEHASCEPHYRHLPGLKLGRAIRGSDAKDYGGFWQTEPIRVTSHETILTRWLRGTRPDFLVVNMPPWCNHRMMACTKVSILCNAGSPKSN